MTKFLFDSEFLPELSLGNKRRYVGKYYEQLGAILTGSDQLSTDSLKHVCPDLKFGPQHYFEVKASGLNNQLIMYEERLKKYNNWLDSTGNSLFYLIFNHNLSMSDVKT